MQTPKVSYDDADFEVVEWSVSGIGWMVKKN